MNTSTVSHAGASLPAAQNHRAPQASPFIRSQSQVGAEGIPSSAMAPSTATKVGQVIAGTTRGRMINVSA
ncbi:MAG TPA: hypothetical protein VMU87_20400 [Stellaceae bacterium]|nr:hypothetical protein [Stellaceae bacterium]